MFKFYINGTQLNEYPDGWDAIQTSIKRDMATGILLYDSAIDFKFYAGNGNGFSIVKTAWENDHYGESIIDIHQRYPDGQYRLIHSGTIFHSSVKFELINNNLSFKTEDRGFYAMINNNKQIETSLHGGKTKNEKVIPVCPSFTLNVHRIDNGNLRHQCQAFKLIDVIKYLVKFMTDDRMTVDCPCFDTGGIYENICIVNGRELAKHNQTKFPILSWETLSTDLVKRLNVQFSIVGTLDAPIMKIDTFQSFYDQTVSLTIPHTPNEIKLETDENLLYSTVEIGSDKTDTTSTLQFPDVYNLTSFRKLSYHFKGTNNIDRKLDLVGKLVVSHACIEVVTENKSGYDAYEDDVFMIQYKIYNNWTWDVNWLGSLVPNKHLFNEMFTNQNILARWSGCFPNDISNTDFVPSSNMFKSRVDGNPPTSIGYYSTGNVSLINHACSSVVGSSSIVYDKIPFWNDYQTGCFDPSNNYGGGTINTPQGTPVKFPYLYYTAPANGYYTFYSHVQFKVHLSNNFLNTYMFPNRDFDYLYFSLHLIKRDSSLNIISSHEGIPFILTDTWGTAFNPHMSFDRIMSLNNTWGTFMNSGEIMECVLGSYALSSSNKNDVKIYRAEAIDGYFGCDGINTGGGQLTPSNPYDYKSMKITFDYPLTLNDYNNLRNSKQGLIEVPTGDGRLVHGWVNDIKFEHNSGETKFILKTDGNTVYR